MKRFKGLLLVACTLYMMPEPALAQGRPAGGPGSTPVIVASAYTDGFVDRVEAIGTLRANESIVLASTVTQTVSAVNFTDGQTVTRGDILVEMTSAEEKALIAQQRALVNEANRQLQRAQELSKSGAISKEVLEQRQREVSATRAGMDALQSRLENYIIIAPFDGVVGLRNVSVGALLQPGTRITTLDDVSVMKLDFAVPSVFLPNLKPGMSITAKATGFPEDFNGEISAIDSQIDEATRSIMVRAIIPNPDGKLKPGLLMTVELLKNPRDAIGIPEAAIVPEGRKHFVFTVDETQTPPVVSRREIVIGTRRTGDLEVLSGLAAGEKVIVQGTMMVRDGSAVSVTAEQQKGESVGDLLKRVRAQKAAKTAEEKKQ